MANGNGMTAVTVPLGYSTPDISGNKFKGLRSILGDKGEISIRTLQLSRRVLEVAIEPRRISEASPTFRFPIASLSKVVSVVPVGGQEIHVSWRKSKQATPGNEIPHFDVVLAVPNGKANGNGKGNRKKKT